MDLDAFSAAHRDDWARLDDLGRRRTYSGAEADELIDRYQSGATELSALKTSAGSTVAGDRLSVSLSRARQRFTGSSANLFAAIPAFFALQLPAALYRLRWIIAVVAAATILVSVLYAVWVANNPQVLANFGTDAELQKIAQNDFVNYYSDNPAASFTGQVWTNNAWITAQCVAFGIVGVYVPFVLLQNAMNIGVSAGVLFHFGYGAEFFQYILPHGMLELTAIFVGAAAGLRIFWAFIAPAARTRGQALAEDGRALFTVAIGLIFVLLVSGVIEGFVTPQPWPWPVKVAIGAVALGAFVFYIVFVGGRASRAGETGDLEEFDAGAKRLIAA
ncbi:stage II sporulation protein M [Subtercola endophyticus]|uniref:stage II sporulation protein M n=1 Tax=Subtercola endophyticus TaxID=2895559 RepID=UPI001E36C745|nr:stage II sporulation protein M [Subtercola endophyticus]UFS57722.1 stage II sporulation protein M [Subtercola endophyticus]